MDVWLRALAARFAFRYPMTKHKPPSGGGSYDHCIHGVWVPKPCGRCCLENVDPVLDYLSTLR